MCGVGERGLFWTGVYIHIPIYSTLSILIYAYVYVYMHVYLSMNVCVIIFMYVHMYKSQDMSSRLSHNRVCFDRDVRLWLSENCRNVEAWKTWARGGEAQRTKIFARHSDGSTYEYEEKVLPFTEIFSAFLKNFRHFRAKILVRFCKRQPHRDSLWGWIYPHGAWQLRCNAFFGEYMVWFRIF